MKTKTHTTRFGSALLALLLLLMVAGPVYMDAQPYTTIYGFHGPDGNANSDPQNGVWQSPISSSDPFPYPYLFTYPFYTYMNRHYTEFVVTAQDLKNAGLCAGPISALSLSFLQNNVNWDAQYRIFIKHYGSRTTVGWFDFSNSRSYPHYYAAATQWFNGTTGIQAARGAVEVYRNSNWTMPIIPQNPEGTWVDWEFNRSNFVWDGNQNIVIGLYRCNNPSMGNQFQTSPIRATYVNPPAPRTGYSSRGFPWHEMYSYTFNGGNCNSRLNYWRVNYAYWYQFPNRRYGPYRPLIRLRVASGISESFPDQVDPRRILKAGFEYDGSSANYQKPSVTFYQQTGDDYEFTYQILDGDDNVVYTALQNGNTTINVTGTGTGYRTLVMDEATGIYGGADGTLDLTDAIGGSYRVQATFTSDCGVSSWNRQFIVAYDNDLALARVQSPREQPLKYPVNAPAPIVGIIQNVGLNDVTEADVRAIIHNPNGGVEYDETVNWTGDMSTGDRSTVEFNRTLWTPREVGLYTVEMCADLKSAVDQQAANDCVPRPGETYTFSVNYNEEPGMQSISAPMADGDYFANRPFQPSGFIENNGILDLSDVPVRLEIKSLPGGQVIYNEVITVPSVDAAFPNNFAVAEFPLFTPPAAGNYEACMSVEFVGDPDNSNNQVCQAFTVGANLAGEYTIGMGQDYADLNSAVDDLYLKGVSAPVTFILTDDMYGSFGDPNTNGAALDLSGFIVGMSDENTVTFKPSLEQSLSKGSVTIALNSVTGLGVLFGQQLLPSNQNSLAQEFPNIRRFSNSNGGFIFDGGQQKSIRFTLDVPANPDNNNQQTPFRAPFYLGDGSSNIELKNLVIENAAGSAPSFASSLPQVFFTNGQFTFEDDVRTVNAQPVSYAAGIVSRAKMPVGFSGNNAERLDTLTNSNNMFAGNEISGFGYGIVTLGIGQLLKGGVNEYREYLNEGTEIMDNMITNVSRAGVIAGFESDIAIDNNTIYNVGQGGDFAAGITLGGSGRYYTRDAHVAYNEIHDVEAEAFAWGVEVLQTRTSYTGIGGSGQVTFAGGNTTVASNVIWGLRRGNGDAAMAGVHFYTARDGGLFTPRFGDFFTENDGVYNNTIVMMSDNQMGAGAIVGVGIQNSNGATLMNNAIALLGDANAAGLTHSAVMYQGTLFRNGRANDWYLPEGAPASLMSDNNAFYAPNAGIARFIEISHESELVSAGSQDEFLTIDQWRNWTGQDINSVVGDFVSEHEFQGIAPNQRLRVKVTPRPPIGSMLNDRGMRIDGITMDIDGDERGAAGQGYDIGADEFDGRLYVSDLEMVDILTPGAYKSTTGQTAEAEYIMTTAPVDVSARVRNSGALPRTNAKVTVSIYRETAASNNGGFMSPTWEGTPEVSKTVTVANLGSPVLTKT